MSEARMISLSLTEKEAVALHLIYSIGSSMLTHDDDTWMRRATAIAVFDAHYSHTEKRGLATKITQLAHAVSAETKAELALRVGMLE